MILHRVMLGFIYVVTGFMKIFDALKLAPVALIATIVCASAAMAVPGTPIGGIIVKGGKNPGGQMLVLATTAANGKFTIHFSEGGEYRLEFVGQSSKELAERARAGLQLDYILRAKADIPADLKHVTPGIGRHTPFHNKFTNGSILVAMPAGGGTVSGELRSVTTGDNKQPLKKGINEASVPVQSPPSKGVNQSGVK